MRNAFAKILTERAVENPKLFLLYGDIGNKLFDEFKQLRPNNFVNAGVAEANMVGVASGLAKSGLLPVVYTINSFLSLKTIEQIKIDVCYQNLPVVFIGTGSALSYSNLGTTHHSLEDFALLSAIPNMKIFAPADSLELERCFDYALKNRSPCYIRIGKKGEKNLTDELAVGEYSALRKIITDEKSKTLLISTGTIAGEVHDAAKLIKKEGVSVNFWTLSQIKPLSEGILKQILRSGYNVIVVEEHTSYGGLSSILAYANQFTFKLDLKMYSINTVDQFHNGTGDLIEARESLGMTSTRIVEFLKKIS